MSYLLGDNSGGQSVDELCTIDDLFPVSGISCIQCAPHLWFLSADFQLYLAAPIVILAYHRNRKLGLILNIAAILFGILTSAMTALLTDIWSAFTVDHFLDHQ